MIELVHKDHRVRYLELWGENEVRSVRDQIGNSIKRASRGSDEAHMFLAPDQIGQMHSFTHSAEGVLIGRKPFLDPVASFCQPALNVTAKVVRSLDLTFLIQTEGESPEATTLCWQYFTRRIHWQVVIEFIEPERLRELASAHACGVHVLEHLDVYSRAVVCFYLLKRKRMLTSERLALASALNKMEAGAGQ